MDSTQIINQINSQGYSFPVKLLPEEEAAGLFNYYKKALINVKYNLLFEHKFKSHLLFQKFNNLIRNPDILNIVEKIIGPNIMCWNSIIFYKKQKSKNFVGWHEDKSFWNLPNDKVVTVSLALTNSNKENGCLKFLKNRRDIKYEFDKKENNMLARGQNAILKENEEFEYAELKPGECSIFRQDVIHGSGPNNSHKERVLFAIRYISTDNISLKDNHKSSTLVRGEDKFNFYTHEPSPNLDFDKVSKEFHNKLMQNQTEIFAKFFLDKYSLSFLSFLVKFWPIRYIYYKLTSRI